MLEKHAYKSHWFFWCKCCFHFVVTFIHQTWYFSSTIFVWVLNMSWHFWHLHYIGRKTDSWWWSFVIYWIYVKSQKGKIIKLLLLVTLCKYSWCKSLLGICNWRFHISYSYPLGIPHFGASIILLEYFFFFKMKSLSYLSIRVIVKFLSTMAWYALNSNWGNQGQTDCREYVLLFWYLSLPVSNL